MITDIFSSIAQRANEYRSGLAGVPVGVRAGVDELRANIAAELPEKGEPAEAVIEALVRGVEPAIVHSASPRYFGFVIGGASPVSVAADWLTSLWNQNAQVFATSPAAALIEDVTAAWLLDLLGLPPDAGVGFVTGTQMAHFTALAVARNAVLRKHGWDMEAEGLQGAPAMRVICGECCHATLHSAVRMIGLGKKNILPVAADGEGRMRLDDFHRTLDACAGPTIVCVQAGNVNTGAFDPIAGILASTEGHGVWVHVDGAFGLWAAASPKTRHLLTGVEKADSWATDAHKWLNVPYDSGLVIIRDADLHRGFKTARCAYAGPAAAEQRDGSQWTPENSRRARAFVLYAALRSLGRAGVQALVDECCENARAFAVELSRRDDVRILNEVVLNQVLCRFEPAGTADADAFNAALAARVQQDGICWLGTTQWQGRTALRISVSNGATAPADVRRSVESIFQAAEIILAEQN